MIVPMAMMQESAGKHTSHVWVGSSALETLSGATGREPLHRVDFQSLIITCFSSRFQGAFVSLFCGNCCELWRVHRDICRSGFVNRFLYLND